MPPVQLPTTPRMQTLIPVHRSALPHLMPIRRQPAVHPLAIRAIQLGLRRPFVQPQKSGLAAVANLKISPLAPVPLLYHRRPRPNILPLATPPSPPISPHLSKSNHRRRLGSRYASSALCASPAHQGPGGGPTFIPLADRLDTDAKDARNGAQVSALLIHGQGAFLVCGARSYRRYRG